MVTFMVITCPHALGLAVPLVVAVSTALSARNGLLIRDRAAFERARALHAVVFDKTGTLTEGRFGVTDVISLEDRKSTRLNSSHVRISYAVFCLKKKTPRAPAFAFYARIRRTRRTL